MSGTIQLQLFNLAIDGINMLKGLRPFIFILDNKTTLGKVCKTWDSIAKNNLISLIVDNPLLLDTTSSKLHHEVLVEIFRCGHDYEITRIQKTLKKCELG